MRTLFLLFSYLLFSTLLPLNSHAESGNDSTQDRTTAPTTEVTVVAKDGTDIIASHYPADGDTLLIWVVSSYSPSERVFRTAYAMADRGFEIWQVDFAEALFQPKSSNFMRNLDAQYVVDVIEAAHRRTKKKIVLVARAYGAIPLLRGATLWQLQHPGESYLSGAILFSPDFFVSIPELGLDPDYLPITSQSTLPLMIYQGGRRGTAWQFPRLLKTLTETNESVYYKVMPDVSGVFYRNDFDPASLNMLAKLPDELPGVIHLLQNTKAASPPAYQQEKIVHKARMDIELKPFKGNNTPTPFSLKDINGQTITLNNTQGKVTVVNFWATWCPPCVEEIPSLNRLNKKMQGKPFSLISINYAESETLISEFLKQVNVEFPVLLDRKGEVSQQWNVIAFPSTFVIGPNGKIHYGINAAIAWDDPKVITKLNELMGQ